MADCREQRRAHLVALGDRYCCRGGLAEAVAFEDDGCLCGEGSDDALVLGAQRSAAQREHERVSGSHLGVGVLGSLTGVRAGDRHDCPCVTRAPGSWRASLS